MKRISALIILPFVFTLFTCTILYYSFKPIISPYINFASLFIYDNETPNVTETQDLFSQITERPVPVPAPVKTQDNPIADVNETTDINMESYLEYVMLIPRSAVVTPEFGDLYGRITISGTNVDAPVFWDDTEPILNMGVGTYTGGWLPGFGRTVLLAGHRNTDFYDLFSAQIGALITVETHYETYIYEITNIAVKHMQDSSAYDLDKEYENIIVYTCYPRDLIGRATERLFVYGVLISGIQVDRAS